MNHRLPSPPEPVLVSSVEQLADLVARWRRCSAIALDTEFIRTRTFYPKLGLVQVSDPQGVFLVDAVATETLDPLAEVLASKDVVKVLHSPGEDLEVFYHALGVRLEAIFDTQIAATLAGLGPTLSYQRLMQSLFDIELPKGEQRSNWLKRPLSTSQLTYAALDVAYLLPAHELLERRLAQLERLAWAEEDFDFVEGNALVRLDPERIVTRLTRSAMNPLQAGALRALVLWREKQARERDLPRSFVLRDETLVELARRLPGTRGDLREIGSLGPRERKRFGDRLVELIAGAGRGQVNRSASSPRRRGNRGRIGDLQEIVLAAANELDLPPEFLASRRLLEELLSNCRDGSRELPAPLNGWRRSVIGEQLLAEVGLSPG